MDDESAVSTYPNSPEQPKQPKPKYINKKLRIIQFKLYK